MTPSRTQHPPEEETKRDALLLVAWVCAVLPTLCGLVLFGLVWRTRSETLIGAGIWVIGGGAFLSFVGTACLASRARRERERKVTSEGRGSASLAALWLVANYPLAAALTYKATLLLSAVVIHVVNGSGGELDFFRLEGAGLYYEKAPLLSGEQICLELHPTRDGEILYAGRFTSGAGGQDLEGTALGYVTPGMGFKTVLMITPSGEVVALRDQ